MGLRGDVPGTSKPATCAQRIDDEGTKCGAPAHNTISGKAEIFGRMINVKFLVCDKHLDQIHGKYSVGSNNA